MKKTMLRMVLLTTLVLSGAGCSASAWQNFKNDPVAQLQSDFTYVSNALGIAQSIWGALSPLLSTVVVNGQPIEATADLVFSQAVTTLQHTLKVGQDALASAVAAGLPQPDLNAIFAPIADALAQVEAVIAQYAGYAHGSGLKGAGPSSSALADLHESVQHVKALKF
jgi:hypothetical protein